MRTVRPCGDTALLVELDSLDDVLALHAALAADPPSGTVDLVPAARTVLVRVATAADLPSVAADVRSREPGTADRRDRDPVEIAVTYDGEDLDDVARHTGLTTDEVVAAHTGQTWTVAFAGFTPGFGYLVGSGEVADRLHVPRRDSSRTRVPAGAVGLAGEFSGVYPRESPGGWQIVGRTDHVLWDLAHDPPAVLLPGTPVRFVRS